MKVAGRSDVVAFVVEAVVVIVCYVAAARFGLGVDAAAGFATLVWPPSGIALAAVMLRGPRLLPAVWLGALIVNLEVGASWSVAPSIATGNAAEALAGWWVLRRVAGFSPSLVRVGDVLIFAATVLAAAGLSASVGVGVLFGASVVGVESFSEVWRSWWLGDAIGALVVAPALMTALTAPTGWWRSRDAAVVVGAAIVAGLVAFAVARTGRPYLVFPVLLFAAITRRQQGASLAIFAVAVGNLWALARVTELGEPELRLALVELQLFMAFTSVTFLATGALSAESQRRLNDGDAARRAAEDASARKTDLLRAVSHELRTPIAALRLQLERIKLTDDDDGRAALLARMSVQTRRLHTLIEGLLAQGRIQTGRMALSRSDVDVTQIVVAAVDEAMPQAETAGLQLRCDLPGAVVVSTDAALLRLVLANLVANAIKFTDKGSVVVAVRGDDAWCSISVQDTGRGIARAEQGRIFEPFEQLGGVAHGVAGVGLGLSLARDLVKLLGGSIVLESEPGHGSTFTVHLPFTRTAQAPAQTGSPDG